MLDSSPLAIVDKGALCLLILHLHHGSERVMWRSSFFRPRAVWPANARGLWCAMLARRASRPSIPSLPVYAAGLLLAASSVRNANRNLARTTGVRTIALRHACSKACPHASCALTRMGASVALPSGLRVRFLQPHVALKRRFPSAWMPLPLTPMPWSLFQRRPPHIDAAGLTIWRRWPVSSLV